MDKETKIKNRLFALILVVLTMPLVQFYFPFIKVGKLRGDVEEVKDVDFSIDSFKLGIYQDRKENFLKNNFGFHSYFIRLNNEWQYDLYGNINANGVLFGTDGFLYEENYIHAYYGHDFIGEDSIKRQVDRLQLITDSLKSRGVELVVLMAPGKGSFYPEHFPESFQNLNKGQTNSEVFRKYFSQSNIHFFDAQSWFEKMKSTVHQEHKLFSKTGIHWSRYGEYLVADSILKLTEKLTGKKMPTMQLDGIMESRWLKYKDDDISRGMNLLFRRPDYIMSYPMLSWKHRERNTTKVMVVGDSYYFGLYDERFSREYLGRGQFWYYFKQILSEDTVDEPNVAKADVLQEIQKHKVVILLCTDANLPRFGFGFIERLYPLLKDL